MDTITIYIGTSCIGAHRPETIVSIVLYYLEKPENTVEEIVTLAFYSYPKAELYAIHRAIEIFDNTDKTLVIHSRSTYIYSFIAKYNDVVLKNDCDHISRIKSSNSDIIKSILFAFVHRSKTSNSIQISAPSLDYSNMLSVKQYATSAIAKHVYVKHNSF